MKMLHTLENIVNIQTIAQAVVQFRFRSIRCATTSIMMIASIIVAQYTAYSSNEFAFSGAQQDSLREALPLRISADASYMLPFHTTAFRGLPTVPTCCPKNFDNVARGLAYAFGLSGELGVYQTTNVGLRLGLSQISTGFTFMQTLPAGSQAQPVSIQHELETSLSYLSIEPFVVFRLFDGVAITAGLGAWFSAVSSYSQRERLLSDSLLFGSTGQSTRNEYSGSPIPNIAAILPSVRLGAGYEIALHPERRYVLVPELALAIPLGNIIHQLPSARGVGANTGVYSEAGVWTMALVKAGLSLRFSSASQAANMPDTVKTLREQVISLHNKQPALETINDIQELSSSPSSISKKESKKENKKENEHERERKPVVAIHLGEVQGVLDNGEIMPELHLHAEEFLASRSRYVLNTIFFDNFSSTIPSRYYRITPEERGSFLLEQLADSSVLQIYYHMLNIIGKRMMLHSKARLTLVGYADGKSEKNDKRLAEQRAATVKKYLQDVWGIEEERMKLKTGISRTPTGVDGDDLLEAEEQRRVEVLCDNPAVLEEMRFDYILQTIHPAQVKIAFRVQNATQASAEWCATISQWDTGLPQAAQGMSTQLWAMCDKVLSSAPISLDWDIASLKESQLFHTPLILRLSAVALPSSSDDATQPQDTASEERLLPFSLLTVRDKQEQNRHDERVDSYTLFSFAYGTNAPLAGNAGAQRIIKQIKQTLKQGAHVQIRGFTDARGNPGTNLALSKQRAESVANAIGFSGAEVIGVGVTHLNDNSLPEGRFYNRFVQVDVRTPIR